MLGARAAVEERRPEVQLKPVAALLAGGVDVPGDLPADHRPDIAHQAFRLAQFAALDGLGDDQEQVVDPIVEVLCAELAPQVKPYAVREYPV